MMVFAGVELTAIPQRWSGPLRVALTLLLLIAVACRVRVLKREQARPAPR
jgi:hypothetical protein